jgi:hypothetical protein
MDYQTYKEFIERTNRRKHNLELQPEEDEFEAQRYTTEWICGRLSLTVVERIDLKQNFFNSRSWITEENFL